MTGRRLEGRPATSVGREPDSEHESSLLERRCLRLRSLKWLGLVITPSSLW